MPILRCRDCEELSMNTEDHPFYVCPICGLAALLNTYRYIISPTEAQSLYFIGRMRAKTATFTKWLTIQLEWRK